MLLDSSFIQAELGNIKKRMKMENLLLTEDGGNSIGWILVRFLKFHSFGENKPIKFIKT